MIKVLGNPGFETRENVYFFVPRSTSEPAYVEYNLWHSAMDEGVTYIYNVYNMWA